MLVRACLLVALSFAALCGLSATEPLDYAAIEEVVQQVNPAQNNDSRDYSGFLGQPADKVAEKIRDNFWFSLFVFLPFLVIPEILLIYVIFKFANRDDGRKPATFMGNHKLEIFWTAVPILTLFVVGFPAVDLLYYQEAPPLAVHGEDDEFMKVDVIGKKFNWVYNYPDYEIEGINMVSYDLSPYDVDYQASIQESAVFPVGKVSWTTFTSADVNHNWGVQALGIRKDCIINQINSEWFKPTTVGFYEGQCYELCGADHGKMILSVAIVDDADFALWVQVQQLRGGAEGVLRKLNATRSAEDQTAAMAEFEESVAKFLSEGDQVARLNTLRFWLVFEAKTKAVFLDVNGGDDKAFASNIGLIEDEHKRFRSLLDSAVQKAGAVASR